MSPDEPPDVRGADFDISVENAPKTGTPMVNAQSDEEGDKRRVDAAAASTYDPAHTHDGKTEEELIEERDHAARLVVDVAIVTGVIAAHEAAQHHEQTTDDSAPPAHHDGGDGH